MNTKSLIRGNWKRWGFALLATGLLNLGTQQLRAEHYDLQDQLLVTGTQRVDTNQIDGMRFIRERCAGPSTVLDRDEVTGVDLKAGLNVLVFKVANGKGAWGGSVRFLDAHDQPVKGPTVTLDPDEGKDRP